MLGQRDNVCSAPMYDKDSEQRYKRNIWEDLIFAVQLLKNFNDELLKLHPEVTHRVRQLIN